MLKSEDIPVKTMSQRYVIKKGEHILNDWFRLDKFPRLITVKFINIEVRDLTKIRIMFNNVPLEDLRTPYINCILYSNNITTLPPIHEAVYLIDENIVQCYALHEIYVDVSKLQFGDHSQVWITVE